MVKAMVKIHGNWCGPNWTGGQKVAAADYKGSWDYPAIDKLDAACRIHDRKCGSRGNLGCCEGDDRKLINAAMKVAANPINVLLKPSLVTTALAVAAGMEIASLTRRC